MRTCVIILGMHRSGTSALAGTLGLLGVNLGKDYDKVGGGEDNKKGNFENDRVEKLNDIILSKLDMSWDSVRFWNYWWDNEEISSLDARAKESLKEQFDNQELFGFKDPRLCITLPFWLKHLTDCEVKVVMIVRNPIEVFLSLHKRNGFSIQKSLELWYQYNISALARTENLSRTIIKYDDLLNDTQNTMIKIADFLGMNVKYDSVKDKIDDFLTVNLRHYNLLEDKALQLWSQFK